MCRAGTGGSPEPVRRIPVPVLDVNADLRALIGKLRADLEADLPATRAWAQINAGAVPGTIPADVPGPVRELLDVADGILAGAFVLFGTGSYDCFPYAFAYMPEFTGVGDEPAKWALFGNLSDEPLLLNRETGAVWYFPFTGAEWYMREEFAEIAPDLDSFLAYYVFGPGYREIGCDRPDHWWRFLHSQGLITSAADGTEDG